MGKATGTPLFPAQDVRLARRPGSFTAPVLSQSQHPWGLETPVLQPQHKGTEGGATTSQWKAQLTGPSVVLLGKP